MMNAQFKIEHLSFIIFMFIRKINVFTDKISAGRLHPAPLSQQQSQKLSREIGTKNSKT